MSNLMTREKMTIDAKAERSIYEGKHGRVWLEMGTGSLRGEPCIRSKPRDSYILTGAVGMELYEAQLRIEELEQKLKELGA